MNSGDQLDDKLRKDPQQGKGVKINIDYDISCGLIKPKEWEGNGDICSRAGDLEKLKKNAERLRSEWRECQDSEDVIRTAKANWEEAALIPAAERTPEQRKAFDPWSDWTHEDWQRGLSDAVDKTTAALSIFQNVR